MTPPDRDPTAEAAPRPPRTLPWAVYGKSHEHEWNGNVGRRFATESRAAAFAVRMRADGWYSVHVAYAPVEAHRG